MLYKELPLHVTLVSQLMCLILALQCFGFMWSCLFVVSFLHRVYRETGHFTAIILTLYMWFCIETSDNISLNIFL